MAAKRNLTAVQDEVNKRKRPDDDEVSDDELPEHLRGGDHPDERRCSKAINKLTMLLFNNNDPVWNYCFAQLSVDYNEMMSDYGMQRLDLWTDEQTAYVKRLADLAEATIAMIHNEINVKNAFKGVRSI